MSYKCLELNPLTFGISARFTESKLAYCGNTLSNSRVLLQSVVACIPSSKGDDLHEAAIACVNRWAISFPPRKPAKQGRDGRSKNDLLGLAILDAQTITVVNANGIMENGYRSGNSASSADLKHGSEEPSKPASGKAGGAMAAIIQQAKTRKRKGSLRKTALLGTGNVTAPVIHNTPPSPASPIRSSRAPYESSSPTSSSENLMFKSTSRVPVAGSQSTTDEDDHLVLLSQSPIAQSPGTLFSKSSTPTDAYFPPISPRHLRPPLSRPSKSTSRSPLASLPPSFPLPTPSEHSYAETAYWGWFILFVTWIVFVVGMGSCFEVWSWAWDVGETPYAPPELEDDPTLPIVGYYPCLIILTGVMAWVWVVVAWVGMKYFKHAKMGGDEG